MTMVAARRPLVAPVSRTRPRLWLLAAGAGVLAAALVTVLTVEAGLERDGLRVIGHQTAPVVVATSDLYFALNDMDAQLANVLLVGNDTNLGFTQAQALDVFEQRRQQVGRDLQQAAALAGDPATAQSVQALIDALGRYEALAARTLLLDEQQPHAAGQPSAAALEQYRQATDLLAGTLLPAARAVADRNAQTLESAYQIEHGRVLAARLWILLIGLLLLAILGVSQVYVARSFHRVVNRWVVVATSLALGLTVAGVVLTTDEAEHLRGAKKDAFDSVLVLNQARAVSYDANADESRFLVDRDRADRYEQAFLAKTQQLVTLDGATLSTFDRRLDAALRAYNMQHQTIEWRGFFGVEFRNITFPGERSAAETTLQRYQAYQLDDRHIRQLATSGRLRDAIAFCTSYHVGDSNYAFDQYDKAVAALIDINQRAFESRIRAGERELTGWPLIPGLAGLAIVALLLLGLRGRLTEYR